MFNIGGGEMFVLGILALLVFGAEGLPGIIKTVVRTVRALRTAAGDFQSEVRNALDLEDLGLDQTKQAIQSAIPGLMGITENPALDVPGPAQPDDPVSESSVDSDPASPIFANHSDLPWAETQQTGSEEILIASEAENDADLTVSIAEAETDLNDSVVVPVIETQTQAATSDAPLTEIEQAPDEQFDSQPQASNESPSDMAPLESEITQTQESAEDNLPALNEPDDEDDDGPGIPMVIKQGQQQA